MKKAKSENEAEIFNTVVIAKKSYKQPAVSIIALALTAAIAVILYFILTPAAFKTVVIIACILAVGEILAAVYYAMRPKVLLEADEEFLFVNDRKERVFIAEIQNVTYRIKSARKTSVFASSGVLKIRCAGKNITVKNVTCVYNAFKILCDHLDAVRARRNGMPPFSQNG